MRLKPARKRSRDPAVAGFLRGRRAAALTIAAAYTVVVLAAGSLLNRAGVPLEAVPGRLAREATLLARRLFAIAAMPAPDRIRIDISFRHYQKLAEQREKALAQFHLEAGSDDFVPADIGHGDETIAAKVRLKGDWIDHFDTDKWSLRVRLRGDQTLFGMKQFSIQHPKTRNYLYEWVYHRALLRENLIALRYEFIEVVQNGRNLGIYALEEHFEKRLIEHNRRIAGPIVRWNEDRMYRIQRQHTPFREIGRVGQARYVEHAATSNTLDPFLAVDLDTFQTSQLSEDPEGRVQRDEAIHLLEAFRLGEQRARDVFDVDSLARFFAISDLLGSRHALQWRNLRFYYNPLTSLLEPIAFDGDAGFPIRSLSSVVDAGEEALAPVGERRAHLLQALFSDEAVMEAYVRALRRISQPAYLDALLAELDEELQANLEILHSEFPDFEFRPDVFYRNQAYIRAALDPAEAILAYRGPATPDGLDLELGNLQSIPVEVIGVSRGGERPSGPPSPALLPGAAVTRPAPVEYQTLRFPLPGPAGASDAALVVFYKLLGTDRVRQVPVFAWSRRGERPIGDDWIRRGANVRSFEFVEVEEATREILFAPGSWILDRDLIVPAGYRVVGLRGTRIELTGGASILSQSPLELVGAEDEPVVISSDGSGGGVVVLRAGSRSTLENVVFHDLSNPVGSGGHMSGAVTFYESPVRVSRSRFSANRSEDALNVVRSQFELENVVFAGTPGDAFDADFSDGRIAHSRFLEIGNDAIDVSGGVVEIRGLAVEGAGDKGLSIGERSRVSGVDLEIRGARIAVASKDSSTAELLRLRIADGGVGLTAFRKKPEFGASAIAVHGLSLSGVSTPYLVERGSSLVVDGKPIEATETDLRSRLYEETTESP